MSLLRPAWRGRKKPWPDRQRDRQHTVQIAENYGNYPSQPAPLAWPACLPWRRRSSYLLQIGTWAAHESSAGAKSRYASTPYSVQSASQQAIWVCFLPACPPNSARAAGEQQRNEPRYQIQHAAAVTDPCRNASREQQHSLSSSLLCDPSRCLSCFRPSPASPPDPDPGPRINTNHHNRRQPARNIARARIADPPPSLSPSATSSLPFPFRFV